MANPSQSGRSQVLLGPVTATSSVSATIGSGFAAFEGLILTLTVTAAVHTSTETYDIYITTTDGVSEWDLVHFPQIAAAITSTPKTYTARIASKVLPQTVTTASPGVAANDSGTIETDTAGSAQGAKTLAAGTVRHGLHADTLKCYVVLAGTDTGPSITYQIQGSLIPE